VAAGALAVVLLAPVAAGADALTPQSGGSPNADDIDSLYKLVLYVALAVFVGVEGTLVYSLVAFRARRGQVAAHIRGNTRLEIAWTIAAGLIVVVITVITFVKRGAIVNPPRAGDSAASAAPAGSALMLGHARSRVTRAAGRGHRSAVHPCPPGRTVLSQPQGRAAARPFAQAWSRPPA